MSEIVLARQVLYLSESWQVWYNTERFRNGEMDMVGRKEELLALERAMRSDESQFVAVYGRRRVGKTYLVREALGREFIFEHVGPYDGSYEEELDAFRDSLVKWGVQDCPQIKTWKEAFLLLEKFVAASRKRRKVIFIDELPWMDTPKSKFLPALGHFWNAFASARKDVVLVVCGSAASWMLKKIVQDKGGLHDRVTDIIYLKPFDLSECEQYSRQKGLKMSRREIAECYMVFGGVPYYWSYLDKRYSLIQNIDRLCFAEGGKLTKEFSRLYASLFKDDERYRQIVRTLSTVRIGMSRDELIREMKVSDGGAWTHCLDDLCESGFVRKYTSVGKKSKGAIYQLVDNFTLFHFQFMEGLVNADEQFWTLAQKSQRVVVWKGLAFERLCLAHVRQIKAALGISGVLTNVFSWRHEPDDTYPWGAQIDLLLERADNVINVCEMKYAKGEFVIKADYEKDLNRKCETFAAVTGSKSAVHLTLITTEGLAHNSHSGVVQSEVILDDLFK